MGDALVSDAPPLKSAPSLILASASPRRLDLLSQISVTPDQIIPAASKHSETTILAADTVVGVGRRILPKTETPVQAEMCLRLMSGRGHRVYTAVAVIDTAGILRGTGCYVYSLSIRILQ